MPVTYTNRKGQIYHLCRGVTRGGKPRYYLARQPQGEPLDQIPEGYEIGESVNGQVFLTQKRPAQIRPEEKTIVEAVIGRHPRSCDYRVDVRGKQIVVYERVGPDAEDLSPLFQQMGGVSPRQVARVRELLDRDARFTPVLRFTLSDKETRTFAAERRRHLGSTDGWIRIGPVAALRQLAQRLIPMLGTDAFFDIDS